MSITIISDKAESSIVTGNRAQAEALVHDCVARVQEQYPGYVWSVRISSDYSVLALRNYNIDKAYGMIIHTEVVQNDPSRAAVVQAAGELLERAQLAREGFSGQQARTLDLTNATVKRTTDKNSTYKIL